MFQNRLTKQYKHLSKWARRTSTSSYRLYDKDIPEIPLSVDLYTERESSRQFLYICLYERPYEKDDAEEELWLTAMKLAAAESLSIPEKDIFIKTRKKLKGRVFQYEKTLTKPERFIIDEGGLGFYINLESYLDTGLFLDHRPSRLAIGSQAHNKSLLNLFCYTGSFSVHACAAGASSTTSVDLSNTYLSWAKDNFTLNDFKTSPIKKNIGTDKNELIKADVFNFLNEAKVSNKKWDIIILDPPTFSNSKDTPHVLDINRDWPVLCASCLLLLAPQGILYFSTNSQKLIFDSSRIKSPVAYTVQDTSYSSIPEDFKNKKVHRMWTFKI